MLQVAISYSQPTQSHTPCPAHVHILTLKQGGAARMSPCFSAASASSKSESSAEEPAPAPRAPPVDAAPPAAPAPAAPAGPLTAGPVVTSRVWMGSYDSDLRRRDRSWDRRSAAYRCDARMEGKGAGQCVKAAMSTCS